MALTVSFAADALSLTAAAGCAVSVSVSAMTWCRQCGLSPRLVPASFMRFETPK